jgi:hypothetical protein
VKVSIPCLFVYNVFIPSLPKLVKYFLKNKIFFHNKYRMIYTTQQILDTYHMYFTGSGLGGKPLADVTVNNGLIYVAGDCIARYKAGQRHHPHFTQLPDEIKFGTIDGSLQITSMDLNSLTGFPQSVKNLELYHNKIDSLLNMPLVSDNIHLGHNIITSLEGNKSIELKDTFSVMDNKLENLIGGPMTVQGNYICCDNPLTSLEGLPKKAKWFLFSMSKIIPILRLIESDFEVVNIEDGDNRTIYDITSLIGKFLPRNNELPLKQRLWKLQQAMIQLGYEGNAIW